MANSAAKTGKIVRFREDKRLVVAGGLRSLATLGFLACCVFCIWQYRDDLSAENLKRVAAYVSSIDTQGGDFSTYAFERGLRTVYAPFGAGLAVASGDTYRYVSALSGNDFTLQLKYDHPVIETSAKAVLIYDRGGRGLCVANSYTSLLNTALESEIISASINQNGWLAVVTDEADYRAAVTVYSDKQKEKYKWQTSKFFISQASVSPDGGRMAALCMTTDGEGMLFTVQCFALNAEDVQFTIDLGAETVYSVKYCGSSLVIISRSGVYIYDEHGKRVGTLPVDAGSLVSFVHHEGEMPLLVLGDGTQSRAVVPDMDGEAALDYLFSGSPSGLDYRGGVAALLSGSDLTALRANGEQKTASFPGARDVVVRDDGQVILVYSDRAERITYEEAMQ